MMKNALFPAVAALGLGWATVGGWADEPGLGAADKSAFNLFNPTPATRMRELSPDRPDKTESPYTLDAGHFLLEMDFANYTYDQTDGTATRAWNLAPFNVKAGLLNNVDVQLMFDDYRNVRTKTSAGQTLTQSGVGDLTARLKINLWGNDGGATALALLPYLKTPTSTDGLGNHAVEGGLILPLAFKLPGDFDLGMETAYSCQRNDDNNHYHADFINSATLGHAIVGPLSGYVEFFSEVGAEPASTWIGTVDAGLEFLVTKNIQLDCGCNFGVTRAADKFNPFAGLTWRF